MAPSSELGEHPFAIDFNAKTGRPIRKLRKSDAGSPFVDSVAAVSDPEDDDDDDFEDTHADTIAAKRPPKRKRSPSPPLPSDRNENDDSSSISSDSGIGMSYIPRKVRGRSEELQPPTVPPLQLTFNVPKGHQGPFVVNLDLRHVLEDMAESIIVHNTGRRRGSHAGVARPSSSSTHSRSKSATSKRAGFLDLPAELRNEIYRLAFVAPTDFNFANPTNFSRGAQFLATCHQVHEEGRSILYAENDFYFSRRTNRYGSFWNDDWNEIGYRSIRKFLKSIGPLNTSLLRHITFLFEDAVPSLNPRLTCNEERRFVHDDALLSVLRHLGDYGALQDITLHFAGRKHVMLTDTRFIKNLKRVQADNVDFALYASPRSLPGGTRSKISSYVENACMRVMERKDKLYASP